ncbi:hypothetical protein R3P38DRAFT_2806102 [Favolaschia claudopus]|uniref:Uncharacterized protein n=1 Tax=Favolaschia claudopus TaxID=2862362 RepID=A0AAV9ZLI4_9AGAR
MSEREWDVPNKKTSPLRGQEQCGSAEVVVNVVGSLGVAMQLNESKICRLQLLKCGRQAPNKNGHFWQGGTALPRASDGGMRWAGKLGEVARPDSREQCQRRRGGKEFGKAVRQHAAESRKDGRRAVEWRLLRMHTADRRRRPARRELVSLFWESGHEAIQNEEKRSYNEPVVVSLMSIARPTKRRGKAMSRKDKALAMQRVLESERKVGRVGRERCLGYAERTMGDSALVILGRAVLASCEWKNPEGMSNKGQHESSKPGAESSKFPLRGLIRRQLVPKSAENRLEIRAALNVQDKSSRADTYLVDIIAVGDKAALAV